MSKVESIAGLLLSEGTEVSGQGWELLRSLPEIAMADLFKAMNEQLWRRVCQVQERARIRKLNLSGCERFVHRYAALRGVCAELSVPWEAAWAWVDGGTASRSWPDQSTTVIALQRGQYRVGRVRARVVYGGYARVALPVEHALRGSTWFGQVWSGGIALSEEEIAMRCWRHPAKR